MRRSRTVAVGAAATLLAGAAWVGVVAANAGSAQSGGSHHSTAALHGWQGGPVSSVAEGKRLAGGGQTLIVIAHTVRDAGVDVGRQGQSPGDFFLFEDTLYNAGHTTVVGRDAGRCELGIRTFTCEATLRLNDRGKLRVAGTLFGRHDSVFPVTGGTGEFRNTGGALQVFTLRNGDELLVFTLAH